MNDSTSYWHLFDWYLWRIYQRQFFRHCTAQCKRYLFLNLSLKAFCADNRKSGWIFESMSTDLKWQSDCWHVVTWKLQTFIKIFRCNWRWPSSSSWTWFSWLQVDIGQNKSDVKIDFVSKETWCQNGSDIKMDLMMDLVSGKNRSPIKKWIQCWYESNIMVKWIKC